MMEFGNGGRLFQVDALLPVTKSEASDHDCVAIDGWGPSTNASRHYEY